MLQKKILYNLLFFAITTMVLIAPVVGMERKNDDEGVPDKIAKKETLIEGVCQEKLIGAAFHGDSTLVAELIDLKANVNYVRTPDGLTPLSAAAQKGHAPIVECLVKNGAILDLARTDGATPLIFACQMGVEQIVKRLVDARADVNKRIVENGVTSHLLVAQNGIGATSLFLAAQNGHGAVVEYLIKNGAAVDLARKDGVSPLMIAVDKEHADIVRSLILAHADLYKSDSDGIIPLHEAVIRKHTGIISLLIEAHRLCAIAPLSAAIKTIDAIGKKQECYAQVQASQQPQASELAQASDLVVVSELAQISQQEHTVIANTVGCMVTADKGGIVEWVPSVIEELPIECLHIIVQHLPSVALAHFRQTSKRCRVAAECEYAQRLKDRVGMEQKCFEALRAGALERARRQEDSAQIVALLEQVPSDLWQAALCLQ